MTHSEPFNDHTRKLLQAHDQQLTLLAGDLHDGLLQYVIAARMMTESLQRKLESNSQDALSEVDSIREYLQRAMDEGRQLVEQLSTGSRETVELNAGLRALVELLTARGPIRCDLQIDDDADLPSDARAALLRVTQEALSNVRRHSQATSVTITVQCHPDSVTLKVVDNGQGFDPASVGANHFGLFSMRCRAESVGGELQVTAAPGHGTRVCVRIPLDRAS